MPDRLHHRDQHEAEASAAASAPGPSIIGSTMVLKGDLSLAEDLVIEGSFHGTIRQGRDARDNYRLSIGERALVKADIQTGSAIIAGAVEGKIESRSTVIVKKTAHLQGALTAKTLRLEPGANVEDVILRGNVAISAPARE